MKSKTKQNEKLEDAENEITDRIEFVGKHSEIFPIRKLVQLQLGFLLI
jgi:hypothetical protein